MRSTLTRLLLCVSIIGASAAHAGNRNDEDSIFPAKGQGAELDANGETQALLATGETMGILALDLFIYFGKDAALFKARKAEAEIQAKLKAVAAQIRNVDADIARGVGQHAEDAKALKNSLRLHEMQLQLEASNLVLREVTDGSPDPKLVARAGDIHGEAEALRKEMSDAANSAAQKVDVSREVNKLRIKTMANLVHSNNLIFEYLKAGNVKEAALLSRLRFFKSVAVVGQGLLLVDVAGRVYVWTALDRNPTVSPIATYVLKHSGKLMSDETGLNQTP